MKTSEPINPLHPKTKELQRLRDEDRREQLAKREAQKQFAAIIDDDTVTREEKEQKAFQVQLRLTLIDASAPKRAKALSDLEHALLREMQEQKERVATRLRKMSDDKLEAYFAAITPFYDDERQARRLNKGVELPVVREMRRDAQRFHLQNGLYQLPVEEQVRHYLSDLARIEEKYGWTK